MSMKRIGRFLLAFAAASALGCGTAYASGSAGPHWTDRITINLRHQVLRVYRGSRIVFTMHVSTGSGHHFRDAGGGDEIAHTPVGDFAIYMKVPTWQHAELGWMYKPMYFYSGYAIHGSIDVPNYPASHGCVRVPLSRIDKLYSIMHVGEPVIVQG
jgi:lipoprotein-anchoring transpeptidase ErfK/SrfK